MQHLTSGLTDWCQDNMAAIVKKIYLNKFSRTKIIVLLFLFSVTFDPNGPIDDNVA